MKRRAVITGIGAITPIGNDIKITWEALCQGQSGIKKITRFDASKFDSQIGGEVKGFDPADYIDKKEIKKMDLFIQYGIAAAQMAVDDARLVINESNALRVGIYAGAGMGGLPAIERYHTTLMEKGPSRVSPFFIPIVIINLLSGQLSIRFGAKGPNVSVVTACASGTHSIGEAFRLIQRGDADIMITGGAEAVICPLAYAGFSSMKALSTRNGEPEKASRPFEKNRDGFVMGEGAGILVIEELEYALKRGARIYAEIIGYGLTGDAYHITSPCEDGSGAARCMQMAINDAQIRPEAVDYINAHGTSTPANDRIETLAIKNVFGEHASKLYISSTKSMIGHLLGAAGGVEAVFTALTIKEGIVPPTINYEDRDADCDLNYVPNKAIKRDVNVAFSNSFGFGGTNACLLFRRY
ncbi:MAG: beta-ketoacyl-ACP synthase II [bacterium]